MALEIPEPAGSLDDSVRALEYAAIRKALNAYGGNRSRAASALGIDKSTFYRKLKRLGITLDMKDGRRKNDLFPPLLTTDSYVAVIRTRERVYLSLRARIGDASRETDAAGVYTPFRPVYGAEMFFIS